MNQAELTIIDKNIEHQLALLRFSAGERKTVFKLLSKLQIELKNKLNNELTDFNRRRVEKLLNKSQSVIKAFYADMPKQLDLFGLAQVGASSSISMLGAISLEASLPTVAVLKSLASGVLLHGLPLSDWWESQSDSLARAFTSQVRLGIVSNETQQQIITRVFGSKRNGTPGIGFPEETLRRNASTLVHDTVMKVANDAKLAVYKENEDLFKGYYQLSTLDSHISKTCIAYSGAQWALDYQPIGDKPLPFDGGCPRHPNCRSLIMPLLKSYKELGYDIKEPPKGTRSSDLGQIDSDTSFDGFLKRHSTEYQNSVLGKGRAELWREGKITLKDLVDGNGRELTLKQLKELL
jgi:hypothetical protein